MLKWNFSHRPVCHISTSFSSSLRFSLWNQHLRCGYVVVCWSQYYTKRVKECNVLLLWPLLKAETPWFQQNWQLLLWYNMSSFALSLTHRWKVQVLCSHSYNVNDLYVMSGWVSYAQSKAQSKVDSKLFKLLILWLSPVVTHMTTCSLCK